MAVKSDEDMPFGSTLDLEHPKMRREEQEGKGGQCKTHTWEHPQMN
ncbi:uncharacterized protein G2W53_043441 [Senna tora]|uniref:Uncharacterized protein n=1 Tax=Senna tora TaxID=362788 RepID=A0A834SL72_9FABA|nr:uncharacterized protein G2W53_043441 [Senna tora]